MKTTYLSRFTPSLMMPETLEQIFVQRQNLAEQIIELIRESATTPSKHYTLLIGPRGIGKTHLISLIYHRICKMEDLRERLLIAWVNEEEWGISSFLDLVVRILKAIEKEYNDSELTKRIESLYQLTVDNAESAAGELLKETIGNRTLLLLIENLDQVFAGLDEQGQKQLRAYLQENSFCTIVATAQSLFNGVKLQTSPFYGFFRIRHLKDLTLDEAVELLAKVAKVQGDRELESFIRTPTGRDRIQAVHYLAGGNPRIYIIFSAFLTRKSLDELVEAFMAMLDDLTPYYQDRMKCLSPQQRKIVDLLCDRRHAVTVKEISQRCFITHQTTSSQLKDLREKGYVSSETIGRESFYELREMLMRFCVEVKKYRGEPIRLFVDFIRIWYTRDELQQRLGMGIPEIDLANEKIHVNYQNILKPLRFDAVLEREYILCALQAIEQDDQDPRLAAYLQESEDCRNKKYYDKALQLAEKAVAIRGKSNDWLQQGVCLHELKCYEEALASYDKTIELDPNYTVAWNNRGCVLDNLNRYDEALVSYDKAIEINPNYAVAWGNRGLLMERSLKRYEEALVSDDKAIELDPNYAGAWRNRGSVLINLERYEEALASYNKAIELDPHDVAAWCERGNLLYSLKRYEEALVSYNKAIELDPHDVRAWCERSNLLYSLKRYEEALASYDKVIELNPNNAGVWLNRSNILLLINLENLNLENLEVFEEALASCDKAIELNPHDVRAWCMRGNLLNILERYEEALASCDKAIELDPHNVGASFIGRSVLDKIKYREALASGKEPYTDESELIVHNILNSIQDPAMLKAWITNIIEIYDKHEAISVLREFLVKSIPALMSEMVSDKASQTWLEVSQEIVGDAKEFEIPLRLLKTAVEYKVKKGDRRVLLELPIEERKLLTEELKIEEVYKK